MLELILAALGVAITAVGAVVGILMRKVFIRLRHVEDTLSTEQSYNRELWWYCRRLLDLYYRHRRPGTPDPDPLPERSYKK